MAPGWRTAASARRGVGVRAEASPLQIAGERFVEAEGGFDHFVGGEIIDDALAGGFGHFLCGGWVAEDLCDGCVEGGSVGGFDEEAGVAVFDDFAEGAAVEGDCGNLVSHGGEQGIVEGFEEGREQEDVEGGVDVFDVGDEASEDDGVRDAEFAGELFELGAAGSIAGEEEFGAAAV